MTEREKSERFVLYMACGVMGIGFAYIFLVTFVPIPASGVEHAKTITGFILGVAITTLITNLWGTSRGSAAKSETMDKILGDRIPPTTSQTVTLKSTETIDKKTEMVKVPETPTTGGKP